MTATDLVLTVTQILRKVGVVDKFVEFYGPGAGRLSLADRATISNMAPEYGATIGFFPVDDETLAYLRATGRTKDEVALVERYCKEQGLFRTDADKPLVYTKTVSLDLATVEPSLAGPKRPQDRVSLAAMKETWRKALKAPVAERGFGLDDAAAGEEGGGRRTTATRPRSRTGRSSSRPSPAAPTPATRRSCWPRDCSPKRRSRRGCTVPPYVKTSLAPGSRVVSDYLDQAGLTEPLAKLGFHTVGYGCTTCIGNSGPLPEPVAHAVNEGNLVASAVISGNRNFEGRVNPLVKANYLASPPLVVAYAIAGTTDIDLVKEPIGTGTGGQQGVPQGHLADERRSAAGDANVGSAADVRVALCGRLRGQRDLERDQGGRGGPVPVGRAEHVHPGAAVSGRPDDRRAADPADCRGPRAWPCSATA